MTDLTAWQQAFAAALQDPDADGAVCALLDQTPGPTHDQGIDVYRNNARHCRVSALESIYLVCRRCVGDTCFAGLAREFVRRSPSLQPDLNRVGSDFADFVEKTVQQQPEFANLPWLPDLARLEWQVHSSYYQADDTPLDLGLLERYPLEQLFAQPRRCLAWMRTPWPVHQIWEAHQGGAEPPTMRIAPGEWYLVVDRIGYQARPEVADAELVALLERLAEGASLAAVAADPRLDGTRLGELVSRHWIGAIARAAPHG